MPLGPASTFLHLDIALQVREQKLKRLRYRRAYRDEEQ